MMKRLQFLRLLLGFLVLAYLLQLFTPLRTNTDAISFLEIAASAGDGHGFLIQGEPSHFPPGYPFLVAALDRAGLACSTVLVGSNLAALAMGLVSAATSCAILPARGRSDPRGRDPDLALLGVHQACDAATVGHPLFRLRAGQPGRLHVVGGPRCSTKALRDRHRPDAGWHRDQHPDDRHRAHSGGGDGRHRLPPGGDRAGRSPGWGATGGAGSWSRSVCSAWRSPGPRCCREPGTFRRWPAIGADGPHSAVSSSRTGASSCSMPRRRNYPVHSGTRSSGGDIGGLVGGPRSGRQETPRDRRGLSRGLRVHPPGLALSRRRFWLPVFPLLLGYAWKAINRSETGGRFDGEPGLSGRLCPARCDGAGL